MLLERLKALREKAKVKQEDLANSIHTSRGTYSMYENGRRQPPYEVLVNLADYYNVSVDYLLGLTDLPDAPPQITEEEYKLLKKFRKLDKRGQQVAFAVIDAEFRHMAQKKAAGSEKAAVGKRDETPGAPNTPP